MSRLAVVILTYATGLDSPRHMYAMRTLEALIKNLRYSGEIHWHIADDGSPIEHKTTLRDLIKDSLSVTATITSSDRRGYGANFNLATQALHDSCSHFLMVEDDWELTRELNLDPLVDALVNGIGCVRLGYIGWTQELRGKIMSAANQTFLLFDPFSPEPHVWAGHPRLETREFQREVGPWPEGMNPGETEFTVAHRPRAREGVIWPMDLGIRAGQVAGTLFAHIGSVQAREDQHVGIS